MAAGAGLAGRCEFRNLSFLDLAGEEQFDVVVATGYSTISMIPLRTCEDGHPLSRAHLRLLPKALGGPSPDPQACASRSREDTCGSTPRARFES